MFERAIRMRLRFSYKGSLATEDLWDLSVQELDDIFKQLNAKLKTESESLLGESTDSVLELKISVIRHIVKVKLAEAEAVAEAVTKRQKKQRILEILAKKQDASLEAMDADSLAKMLDEL